ncbi:multiple sugar transport system permease protein [Fervidobacterium changbaicum]|uniref:Carbohydrate ABC transporter permease n=2 Tax=Fervidobacterium TaxID=2422 RepID=A0AAI8CK60_FERIS|nr:MULTISPECIES: carbohydrate ABC transporter permease [Fervidobacterium]AMW32890.1 carbohydrate ABC transporter permease [Fervidobacterium islandicum]QAV32929.1 carbohydrate ABC transporter permease [Fervidobacterium changbaicum]SDH47997.1 multiple sugar transport system permease protein [Fervidobacterium changbaicum]
MKTNQSVKRLRKKLIPFLILIVSLFVLMIELMPIMVVVTSGFKRDIDIWARGPFYFKPTLESYKQVLSNRDFLLSLKNSLVVGLISTAISIIVGSMASYGLTRYVFKFKEIIAYTFLGFRMIPQISLVIPLYVMFNYLKLRDTLTGIVLAHVSFNIPYVVWLLLPFFAAVPRDYEEAARVDGATENQVFWRIFFPLVSPGLVVASVFAFLMSWNEFLYALILTSVNARTAPVAVNGLLGQYAPKWGQLTAAGTIMLIPVFVITLTLQKYIIKGLISGGIKG